MGEGVRKEGGSNGGKGNAGRVSSGWMPWRKGHSGQGTEEGIVICVPVLAPRMRAGLHSGVALGGGRGLIGAGDSAAAELE